MLIRRIALLALATALVAAVAAAPAFAGKTAASPCSTPMLSGPSQERVGDVYTVQGCGFAPGALVPLEIGEADGCCLALNVLADSSGRFAYSGSVWAPGTYRIRAAAARKGSTRMVVVAAWSFAATQ